MKNRTHYVMVQPSTMPTRAWTPGQWRAVCTALRILNERKASTGQCAVSADVVAAVCTPTISTAVARRALRELRARGVLASIPGGGCNPEMFYPRWA